MRVESLDVSTVDSRPLVDVVEWVGGWLISEWHSLLPPPPQVDPINATETISFSRTENLSPDPNRRVDIHEYGYVMIISSSPSSPPFLSVNFSQREFLVRTNTIGTTAARSWTER